MGMTSEEGVAIRRNPPGCGVIRIAPGFQRNTGRASAPARAGISRGGNPFLLSIIPASTTSSPPPTIIAIR